MRYVERDGEPVYEPDLEAWARYMEFGDRVVAQDKMGDVLISTVFLGVDHNWRGKGPPILYETMVFGGELDHEQVRYCTRAEAEHGHRAMILRVIQETYCHGEHFVGGGTGSAAGDGADGGVR